MRLNNPERWTHTHKTQFYSEPAGFPSFGQISVMNQSYSSLKWSFLNAVLDLKTNHRI